MPKDAVDVESFSEPIDMGSSTDLGPFSASPTPPEDWLRIFVTLLFSFALISFLGLYLYAAMSNASDGTWQRTKEAFAAVLPALTGTLGTVIGFYFGNRNK
jgi:hypothetical protein